MREPKWVIEWSAESYGLYICIPFASSTVINLFIHALQVVVVFLRDLQYIWYCVSEGQPR